nr:MAG TPA: hypothetical protein [Caudoviricetes sp.]
MYFFCDRCRFISGTDSSAATICAVSRHIFLSFLTQGVNPPFELKFLCALGGAVFQGLAL